MLILVDLGIGLMIIALAALIFALGLKVVRGDKKDKDGQ